MEEYIKIWNKKKKKLDRENTLDRLAGQPIQICYKMTKKSSCTQSGFAKKKNSGTKISLKKTQTHKKLNYGRHPLGE
jgi:hypothetical protein